MPFKGMRLFTVWRSIQVMTPGRSALGEAFRPLLATFLRIRLWADDDCLPVLGQIIEFVFGARHLPHHASRRVLRSQFITGDHEFHSAIRCPVLRRRLRYGHLIGLPGWNGAPRRSRLCPRSQWSRQWTCGSRTPAKIQAHGDKNCVVRDTPLPA